MSSAAIETLDLKDEVTYDNKIVACFLWATVVWGVVGFFAGILIALQLSGLGTRWGPEWLNQEWTGFGRLRPLHTNAAIFAFTGNAVFAGVYYSIQRLLKARLWSDFIARFHFWGWQLIIVSAALTLPFGITTSKEYAELEWPIDIAITLAWVAFSANLIGTIFKRRERHLYVAIWFYLATVIGIALLHIVNSLAIPVSLTKSYSIYAGQQDALVQWWYGHNAVAFFLTTPLLGLMYYFLPKAAERPVYSYRLSIIHFWSLVFIYIWAGPHHLLHTSLPGWAQTLGVIFSVVLWMPSWGGMINGLLTLRGAFHKVRKDPVLKFFVVAVTFYGMSTFEGPLLATREINALSHNTEWTVGHVHSGTLGWVGCLMFGIVYWLMPRLYKTELYSVKMADWHFWLATIGIVLYAVTMWMAGITQGLMWFDFTEEGTLRYTDWKEIINNIMPYYWIRAAGGAMYGFASLLMVYNCIMTAKGRKVENETVHVAPLAPEPEADVLIGEAMAQPAGPMRRNAIHALVERWPFLMIMLIAVGLIAGSAMEVLPNMVQGALTPKIASVKPYTPLELYGRDMYIREGCVGCHTQMVRTLRADTARYGENLMDTAGYTRAGEHIYDRPFLWGSKRTGPDLAREGLLRPDPAWHLMHMYDPNGTTSEDSIMPAYPQMYRDSMDFSDLGDRLAVLAGPPMFTPYSKEVLRDAAGHAQAQADEIAERLRVSMARNTEFPAPPELGGNWDDLHNREIIAMIAYLLRLGTDLQPQPEETTNVAAQ